MMPIPNIKTFALLSIAWALVSCVVPKAIVVEEPATEKKLESAAELRISKSPPAEVERSEIPDDGTRMPDMLGMPGDGDFRSPHAIGQKVSGAVISRPPTDPPSRLKPKPEE